MTAMAVKPSLRRLSGAVPGSRPGVSVRTYRKPADPGQVFLLGIDLGTSGVRALLLGSDGHVRAIERRSYPLLHPAPGWTEQDPELWWQATKDAVVEVIQSSGVAKEQIHAVGLSGQMHGVVLVDTDGHPLRPAIVWLDKRSDQEGARLTEAFGARELHRTTGMAAASGLFGPSLMWLKGHEEATYLTAHRAVLPKDYLRLRMTAEIATDPSDASGSLLFDVRRRGWALDVIEAAGLREDLLPAVRESMEIAGVLTDSAAAEMGLLAGTPVATGGGDQAMSAIGSGLLEPGLVRCAIGTGGQSITVTLDPFLEAGSGLYVLCHAVPELWLLMGATLSAGLALKWFGEAFDTNGAHNLELDGGFESLSVEASKIAPGSNGLLFLPFLVGERTPHMDSKARACFIGLDLSHRRGHFIRSIMEGVTYSMKDSLVAFEQLGIPVKAVVASGGAARSNLWQWIQTNVYGTDLLLTSHSEHSALGAAMTAGVAISVFEDVEHAWSVTRGGFTALSPEPTAVELYRERYAVYRSLYPALSDVAW